MLKRYTVILIAISFLCGVYASVAAKGEKNGDKALGRHNTDSGATDRSSNAHVVEIEINGTINPATTDYIKDGIELAVKQSADALLILMDTPGGLLSSTKDIVKLLLNSPVPVIVYVSPSGATATSAGVFITLSANVAAMADGTSIGAAHPVSIGGGSGRDKKDTEKEEKTGKKEDDKTSKKQRSQEEIMGEKIENFASSFIESIAEKRKRNTKWAIEAVRKSASITSKQALEKKVIDIISRNRTELFESIDGWEVELPDTKRKLATKGAVVKRLDMNVKQKMINILSTPNIAFLLLSLGSLGLTMEIFKPGMIFPGVVGAICFLTGCVSLQILPFNYAGLALLVLAIALFVSELYVTSYGLLAVAGLVSFVIGGVLLFETPESNVRVSLDVILSVGVPLGLFFVLIAYFVFRAQQLAPATGQEALIGKHGEATTDIIGVGKVFVFGEYWNATSEDTIPKGSKIEVLGVEDGMIMTVKKL